MLLCLLGLPFLWIDFLFHLVNYCVAKGIVSTGNRKIKRITCCQYCGQSWAAGIFKYFNFFDDSAAPILESLGVGTSSLSIILPVGISAHIPNTQATRSMSIAE